MVGQERVGVGSGGRWGAEGGFFLTFEQKSSHCVFIVVDCFGFLQIQSHNLYLNKPSTIAVLIQENQIIRY